MKLWKLTQNVNNDYDSYDSVVVAAKTEEEARLIRPDSYNSWDTEYRSYSWAEHPYQVQVELIGNAVKGTKEGIILASFNAG